MNSTVLAFDWWTAVEVLRPAVPGLALLVSVVAIGSWLRSPAVKGWFGEWRVRRVDLRGLDPAFYTVFNDLYLPRPDGDGTTQVDHVVVSAFGIFVIETKNLGGLLYGTASDRTWTQVFNPRSRRRIQNPLHQNALHVRALARVLELSTDQFHSIVHLVGDARLMKDAGPNVLTRGLESFIDRHQTLLLDLGTIERVNTILRELDESTDRRQARRRHLADLRRRHA